MHATSASGLTLPTNFPQELTDAVVDYFDVNLLRDVKSLIQLSRVSRAFLPRTRARLFETLYVRPCQDMRSLEDFAVLVSTALYIGPSIQHLRLIGDHDRCSSKANPHSELDATTLASFLDMLPNLKSLHLTKFDYGIPRPNGWPNNSHQLESLKFSEMEPIESDPINSFRCFLEIISLFENITHLIIYTKDFGTLPRATKPFAGFPGSRLPIQRLSIEGACVPARVILKTLQLSASVLRSLHIPCTSKADFKHFVPVIKTYGPHLETLGVELSFRYCERSESCFDETYFDAHHHC